jgi:hypothetical protein
MVAMGATSYHHYYYWILIYVFLFFFFFVLYKLKQKAGEWTTQTNLWRLDRVGQVSIAPNPALSPVIFILFFLPL